MWYGGSGGPREVRGGEDETVKRWGAGRMLGWWEEVGGMLGEERMAWLGVGGG